MGWSNRFAGDPTLETKSLDYRRYNRQDLWKINGAARNNLEEYKYGKQASFYTEYLSCTGRKLVAD